MPTRVLIIEDHAAIRDVLRASLEMEGYSVSLARDGHEGLAQLEAAVPALILLDLGLPGMDGCTFLKILEEQRPELSLPIIIITADSQAATKLAGKLVKIFPKPFSLHPLIRAIKGALNAAEDRPYVSSPSGPHP
jgi:CheY-like chemotaxis protein